MSTIYNVLIKKPFPHGSGFEVDGFADLTKKDLLSLLGEHIDALQPGNTDLPSTLRVFEVRVHQDRERQGVTAAEVGMLPDDFLVPMPPGIDE